MNPVRFIKRILKIGGPRIDLATRDSTYYPSESIGGELLITAPDHRQSVGSITINLKEFWIENLLGAGNRVSRVNRYRQHGSIAIVNDLVLLPRMKYQFPFEIKLPANCRVSTEESGWRLGVVVNTSGSSVKRADFNVNVQLSKVLQKIIEAVEEDTRFIEVPEGRKYIPDVSATRFVFRPPEHLQSKLQYLILDVSLTEEDGIKGNMLFNMVGEGAGKSRSHEFQIEPPQSLDSTRRVETGTLTKIISDELKEAVGDEIHS
jgi:hypothetical protein